MPDTPQPFSAVDALRFGWEATQRNAPLFVGLCLLQFVVSSLEGGSARPHAPGGLVHLLAQVAGLFLAMGWWRIALRVHDGQPADLGMLKETTLPAFLQYFLVNLVLAIAVGLGTVLLVVPGILAALTLGFAPVIAVDKGVDFSTALLRSVEITRGHRVHLFVLALFALALNLGGLLLLGLGLFATVPTTLMAVVFVYRRLDALVPFSPTQLRGTTA
jgi:uncharacterized membrane protein